MNIDLSVAAGEASFKRGAHRRPKPAVETNFLVIQNMHIPADLPLDGQPDPQAQYKGTKNYTISSQSGATADGLENAVG